MQCDIVFKKMMNRKEIKICYSDRKGNVKWREQADEA